MFSEETIKSMGNLNGMGLNMYSFKSQTRADTQRLSKASTTDRREWVDFPVEQNDAKRLREDISDYINENHAETLKLDVISIHVAHKCFYLTILCNDDTVSVVIKSRISDCSEKSFVILKDLHSSREKTKGLSKEYVLGFMEIFFEHIPLLQTRLFLEPLSTIEHETFHDSPGI